MCSVFYSAVGLCGERESHWCHDHHHHYNASLLSLLCEFVSLTFLSDPFLHIRIPGNHDNLDHETVATLPDHIDHLPVSHLNHILTIHLEKRKKQYTERYRKRERERELE